MKEQNRIEEPDEIIVRGNVQGLAQEVRIGKHQLKADEPESVGGTNAGPTPYGLLLASLGACTSMTITLYARRKQWPLTDVTVRLRHSKLHAVDCSDCETKEGKLDEIERNITLEGELTDEQRRSLFAIAERCPVHRTLTSEIKIRTTGL
jgi:putative redox protein